MEADETFEAWYRDEHRRLIATMSVLSGNRDIAKEVVDEAFGRALARWPRVSAMASPSGWTYRVALNVLRRRQRRQALERKLLSSEIAQPSLPPAQGELWFVVQSLPARQRTAVLLRYLGDLSEAEIADAMGIARGTVSSTLVAARKRLGALLKEEEASTAEGPYA